jgi:hypothetical protein
MRFAWLPTRMDDGATVWLETYHDVQAFQEWRCGASDELARGWRTVERQAWIGGQ